MEDLLKELLQQEQDLQFNKFNELTAWEIGSRLVNRAIREKLPITVDITRGEQQLFHASLPGTSADNDEWVKRKTRLVNRFGHSSYYMGQLIKSKGRTLEEVYAIPESLYADHGGCFPILIKETGIIGTITVSGLAQAEDHRLVVETLREFLKQEQ